MSDVHFAGVKLDDDARTEAIAHLSETVRVVVVPVANSTALPNPWLRFPQSIAWLVADVLEWGSVVSRDPLSTRTLRDDLLESGLADAFGRGEALVLDPVTTHVSPGLPSVIASCAPVPAWLRDTVKGMDNILGQPIRSEVDLIAVQAGILQMANDLTASHEYSQSIEGRGKHHAGDYWHAINHRREPDYGNAKYWFRHVGSHPLLADLAQVVPALADEFSPAVRAKGLELIEGNKLDPLRFVDLISEACRRKDGELTHFAERLQWIEMIGLMEWTMRDVVS